MDAKVFAGFTTLRASPMKIERDADIDQKIATVWKHAAAALISIRQLPDDPVAALRRIKFDKIGMHPIEDRPLNLIEQVNQTFTFLVALQASKLLLQWHPEITQLTLMPGAHAPKGSLDIESHPAGLIGAETFAAPPKSNQKLKKDLEKLSLREEENRYIFFTSPEYSETVRQPQLENFGVIVWSVELPSIG